MRGLSFLVALLFWPLAGMAQDGQSLDLGRLDPQDIRYLQAALVWSGDYVGLTDGEWGERSEAALESWRVRAGPGDAPGDLQPLLERFAAEVATNGWETFNLAGTLTVALPASLLQPSSEDADGMELRSASGDLVFRILFGTWPEARDMHAWMIESHAGAEPPYQSARDDRLVSAIAMGNGKRVYLRSALVDGIAVSMQVVSEPPQRLRADLIASSMQWGTAPDLAPRPGGALEAVMVRPLAQPDLSRLPGRPQPPPKVVPPMAPATALVGTGTGFYVNNTDIVTAAHVVQDCREMRLEDGSALRLLGSDPRLDLAVLSAEQRSEAWLPIAVAEGPRLGEPVFALGFPFYGSDIMANQGLSVTGGNVSALPRVSDAASRIMISAPVQPGNSGGPLLGDGGAVLGVVVARVDDLYTLEHEGSLPQNMNYATSVQQLVAFLQAAHVFFPSAPDTPALDLSRGIPDEVQAAVVLIACY